MATCNLSCTIDLKHLAMSALNAEYQPKVLLLRASAHAFISVSEADSRRCDLQRFSAVILRILEPKTTALVFSTGKMVVTGAKSELLARIAARKFAR